VSGLRTRGGAATVQQDKWQASPTKTNSRHPAGVSLGSFSGDLQQAIKQICSSRPKSCEDCLCEPWFNKIQCCLSNMQRTNWSRLLQCVTTAMASLLLIGYGRLSVSTGRAGLRAGPARQLPGALKYYWNKLEILCHLTYVSTSDPLYNLRNVNVKRKTVSPCPH
jgi:hypothetical protein